MAITDQVFHLEEESKRHAKNIHEIQNRMHEVDLKHTLAEKSLELEVTMLKTKFHIYAGLASGLGAFAGAILSGLIVYRMTHG